MIGQRVLSELAVNHDTLFNIHNSSPDHRDRGKRLRLPSYPQIENASD